MLKIRQMAHKKNIKIGRIGRGKKTLFDVLSDNNIIGKQAESKMIDLQSNSDINIIRMIEKLHGFSDWSAVKKKRIRVFNFLNNAQEKPQRKNDSEGRTLIYKYSAAQKLKLASYLLEISYNAKRAALEIQAAARKEENQNETFYYIETINQFHKKKETAKTKEVEKSIFGNIIK
jgi:hypothetical protein